MLRSPTTIVDHGSTSGGIIEIHLHSSSPPHARKSLFDSCHRKIRLIGGGPVAFLGGLVAKARRKEREGDQSSSDTKLYLEENVLERKLPDADLKTVVDIPVTMIQCSPSFKKKIASGWYRCSHFDSHPCWKLLDYVLY